MEDRLKAAVWLGAGERARTEEIELVPPQAGEVEVEVAAEVFAIPIFISLSAISDFTASPPSSDTKGREPSRRSETVSSTSHLAIGFAFASSPLAVNAASVCAVIPISVNPARRLPLRVPCSTGAYRMRRSDGTDLQQFLTIGAFAERTVVPAQSVVKIPSDLAFAEAALIGCAVVTGFGAVTNAGRVQAGDRVAVIGCGGVGLQVIAAAAMAGAAEIVAIDPMPEKEELALAQGATSFFSPENAPHGFDRVFEVVGRPETIEAAWKLTAPGGAVIVVGIAPAGTTASISAIDFSSEKSLIGSFYGSGNPAAEIAYFAGVVARGDIDLSRTVTHRTDLAGINEAFERMQRGEGARTVVEF